MEQGQVGCEPLEVESAGDIHCFHEALRVGDGQRRERGRERIRVEDGQSLLGLQVEVGEECVSEIGHRGQIRLSDRAEHADGRLLAVVQGGDDALGDLGPDARRPLGEHVGEANHRGARDLGGGRRPRGDAVIGDQGAVEGRDFLAWDQYLLARSDTSRHSVDDVAPLDDPLDERARLTHVLDRGRIEGDLLAVAGDAHDFLDGQAVSGKRDRHFQTSAAVSTMVRSLARSSSRVSALPRTDVAKPH